MVFHGEGDIMKLSARCLMAGLTAVFLFLLLVACTTPTEVTETAVPPTTTPIPATATTAPTPEPTATLTLTAEQLRDERATAVLTTLPGYDPAHHDALLPLARALWGDEYVIDPADVTIVVGETAVRITANAAYPSGTLFVWNDDSNLLILTGQPDTTLNRGEVAFGAAPLDTWIRYDLDGNVLEFVDPAGHWISPLDLQEDGRFTFYTQEQIGPNGERQLAQTIWWANGGTPVELTTSPIPGQSLTDYLAEMQLQLTQTIDDNDQHLVALADADGNVQFTYNPETRTWVEALDPIAALTARTQEQYLNEYGIELVPEATQIDPITGHVTMYSYGPDNQLVETARTAHDENGLPQHNEQGDLVMVFATETYALAHSKPLPGGNLADRIHIYYADTTRVTETMNQASMTVLDPIRVAQTIDAFLQLPSLVPVQNVLDANNMNQNHLLSAQEAAGITNLNVIIGSFREPTPGFRAMYTNTTNSRTTQYGYFWNPNTPNELTIILNLDNAEFTNIRNGRNWLVLSGIQGSIALLQAKPGTRPVQDFPKSAPDLHNGISDSAISYYRLATHNPEKGHFRAIDLTFED